MSKNKMNSQDLGEKIVKELKSIFDPEIPVDIYELGSVSYTHLTLPTKA